MAVLPLIYHFSGPASLNPSLLESLPLRRLLDVGLNGEYPYGFGETGRGDRGRDEREVAEKGMGTPVDAVEEFEKAIAAAAAAAAVVELDVEVLVDVDEDDIAEGLVDDWTVDVDADVVMFVVVEPDCCFTDIGIEGAWD